MKKKGLLLFAVIIYLFFTGCATAPMATKSEDLKAKSFITAPDKSNIYVFRDSSFGTAAIPDIILDGRVIGVLPIKAFHLLKVSPGKHIVATIWDIHSALLELEIEPEHNYFIRVFFKGFLPRVSLEFKDETEGKEKVIKLKLVKSEYN